MEHFAVWGLKIHWHSSSFRGWYLKATSKGESLAEASNAESFWSSSTTSRAKDGPEPAMATLWDDRSGTEKNQCGKPWLPYTYYWGMVYSTRKMVTLGTVYDRVYHMHIECWMSSDGFWLCFDESWKILLVSCYSHLSSPPIFLRYPQSNMAMETITPLIDIYRWCSHWNIWKRPFLVDFPWFSCQPRLRSGGHLPSGPTSVCLTVQQQLEWSVQLPGPLGFVEAPQTTKRFHLLVLWSTRLEHLVAYGIRRFIFLTFFKLGKWLK